MLLSTLGPLIDPFISVRPWIKVVVIKPLWLDSGPSPWVLCVLSFFAVCYSRGGRDGLYHGAAKGLTAEWVPRGFSGGVSWQPQVETQVNYTTPSDALTWSMCFAAQLLGLIG